jgi:hypothetical protein
VHSVYLGSAKRANFYADDTNVIAFSKDAKGWAGFNKGAKDAVGLHPRRPNLESDLTSG